MAILLTGGCGYIGSHIQKLLLEKKKDLILVDTLKTGHIEAFLGGTLYQEDVGNRKAMRKIFQKHPIDAVIHMAASSLLQESIQNPFLYYKNNLFSTACLLEEMRLHQIDKIIFSSTCAVYGNNGASPLLESSPTNPTSAYGQTKLAIEKMFFDFERAFGLKFISLRFFNAAGADPSGSIGEVHFPETHLIPTILHVLLNRQKSLLIYGDDYPTTDGTCIRDYIHVCDLANAHYLALQALLGGGKSSIYNLGNGQGFSVLEIVKAAEKLSGKKIPLSFLPRRAGDCPILIADTHKIQKDLGWKAEFPQIETILKDAYLFQKKHPYGYKNSPHTF